MKTSFDPFFCQGTRQHCEVKYEASDIIAKTRLTATESQRQYSEPIRKHVISVQAEVNNIFLTTKFYGTFFLLC